MSNNLTRIVQRFDRIIKEYNADPDSYKSYIEIDGFDKRYKRYQCLRERYKRHLNKTLNKIKILRADTHLNGRVEEFFIPPFSITIKEWTERVYPDPFNLHYSFTKSNITIGFINKKLNKKGYNFYDGVGEDLSLDLRKIVQETQLYLAAYVKGVIERIKKGN